MAIQLGNHVRDRVSGFEGFVTSRHDFLHGSVQFGVTGPTTERHPEGVTVCIDEATLEKTDKPGTEDTVKQADTPSVSFGDEVEDTVSGYRGVVNRLGVYLNGCVLVSIQARADKDMKVPDRCWVDHKQVKVIKPKKVDVPQKRTGGPSSIIARS